MILVVDGLNRERFVDLLDEMFRLRARVFADRLGWAVDIRDGMEVDQFDALDPAYVLGLDDSGHVVACARLLQTTGPHMLSDVFNAILGGEPPMRSATLWESTRFCVDTERLQRGNGPNSLSRATMELMVGTLEYARNAGIRDIITVIDPIMNRLLKRSNNAPYDYVGQTTPMGKVPAMAALLDTGDERIQRVRAFAGIEGDVFLTEDAAEALVRAGREAAEVLAGPAGRQTRGSAIAVQDMLAYCRDQLHSAQTPADKAAAAELVSHIARTTGLRELHGLIRTASH